MSLKATTQVRPSPLHLSPVAIAIAFPPSLYVEKHLQLIFKLVSCTQPETTYQIFTRATFNLDVATGKVRTTSTALQALRPASVSRTSSLYLRRLNAAFRMWWVAVRLTRLKR